MIILKKGLHIDRSKLPGVITPEEAKVGIMPGFVFKKGNSVELYPNLVPYL